MSGHLNPGGQRFRDDHGATDPRVAAALAAYQTGRGSEQAALTALAAARLLVPVIAVLAYGPAAGGDSAADEPAADGPAAGGDSAAEGDSAADGGSAADADKNSEMVLPTLIGRDGRSAILAFTGLEALARWRPDARPMPAEANRVWRAAVADGCAVVIDVAGPVPLAVEGARLGALAAREPVPSAHEDPDVRAEVEAAIAGEPAIAGFSLAPGRAAQAEGTAADEADATDLTIRLRLADSYGAGSDWQPVVSQVANGIAARLAGRLRRGVEFSVTPTP